MLTTFKVGGLSVRAEEEKPHKMPQRLCSPKVGQTAPWQVCHDGALRLHRPRHAPLCHGLPWGPSALQRSRMTEYWEHV